jgi:hypothetical protein
MAAMIDEGNVLRRTEDAATEGRAETAVETVLVEERRSHAPLPWIGSLPNPRLGPMLVINDNGYLVPLCTAGDLLRGCRYFWGATRN